MEVIVGKQGNQRIPITDEFVSRKHCKITSNGDGSYTLENLSQNGTFVDGRKILKTKVFADTIIQLGPNFSIKVSELLPITRTSNNSPITQKEYSIKHLEPIWDDYHKSILELQSKKHKLGLLIRTPMLFTIGGGFLTTITALLDDDFRFLTYIGVGLTLLGIVLIIYFWFKSKKFNPDIEKDRLDAAFQDKYICPNPDCHHYLDPRPYKILIQDKVCRWCRCKYTSN